MKGKKVFAKKNLIRVIVYEIYSKSTYDPVQNFMCVLSPWTVAKRPYT